MSDSVIHGGRVRVPLRDGFWPVVVTNAVLGLPAYFISFLFAYGFRDVVGGAEHLSFLLLVAIFAIVSGLIGAAFWMTSRPRPAAARRAAFGVLVSLALNSAVVGAGSVVSAANKDEGSVSAAFSTPTDVLVAALLFVLAAALGTTALRVGRRPNAAGRD